MTARLARAPARRARRLPLRGADLVLMAMHRLWPGAHLSNNTMLVVECDAPVDAARVRQAIDRFLDVCPWPAARLRRGFPWGKRHWAVRPRAALVPPPVREVARPPAGHHAFLENELASVIEPRRESPLRVTILGATLVLTWFHPLMDPRGGQNLLAHLARADERGDAAWEDAVPAFVPAPERRPLRERGRLARRSVEYMRSLMAVPPVSPGTGLAAPGRVRFRQERFVDRDPGERRQITWRLAVVGRAMADLWQRRGLPDVPFLVPISVDLRAKGDPEPTFGNALAFHFARFRPSETGDLAALERQLRAQMVAAMRDDQIEANRVAMEFLQYRPFSMMLRDLPGTARGETFSFNCADVGDFPRLPSVFGRRIVNAYHVPAVLPRPGLGVFFNRCAGRENVVVSWIDGAAGDEDVTRTLDLVREAMRWTRE